MLTIYEILLGVRHDTTISPLQKKYVKKPNDECLMDNLGKQLK
jgi:hypothetical protein